jgi:hypothetical protein
MLAIRLNARWWQPSDSFDLLMPFPGVEPTVCDMKPSDKPRLGKDEPPPKLSRSEEARRIIEEHVDQLREIIKKLRRRLH